MQSKQMRAVVIALAVAALALAGYWYGSPYLQVRSMAAAAEAGDAERFNAHVDYPRLRDSLKGQFTAKMTKAMGPTAGESNPLAGLGAMLGAAFVNQMVEAMVRPELVMEAIQEGKLAKVAASAGSPAVPDASGGTAPAGATRPQVKWEFERIGVDKLLAYAIDPTKPDAPKTERVAAVFERTGFASWKLTELRLPASL